MKAHHLSVLIVVAIVAIVAAFWTSGLREPGSVDGGAGDALIPGLSENINDVTGVRIVLAGEEPLVTLQRGETTWTVAENNNYPADTARVRELLIDLADATLAEEKTSNPEYYSRLGVEDLSEQGATGVRVEIEGLGEDVGVILGNAASSRTGTYVRRTGETRSFLASASIRVSKDAGQWLNKDVMDVSSDRIAEVEVTHPDGATLVVNKSEPGQTNFDVPARPDDRELERANIANAIGGVLQRLRFDEVVPAAEFDVSERDPVVVQFRSFDGLVVSARTAKDDEDNPYVSFDVTVDPELAQRFAAAAESAGEEGEDAAEPAAAPEVDLSAVTAEADAIRARTAGWAYRVPQYKYEQLTRKMEDLLASEDEEG